MSEYELPTGWASIAVDELAELVEYGTSEKTNEDAGGVPVIRMGNIVAGALVLDSLKYLPTDHHEFPRLLLKRGDLLFNRTNSPELVGKSAVFQGTPEKCSFASYLIRLRLRRACLPDYLSHFINSPFGRLWVNSVVTQQVGQANVNGSKLRALEVPVAPVAEQRRIVDAIEEHLSDTDAGAAALERALTNLKRYRAAVLKAACEGKLVATEAELARKAKRDYEPAEVLLKRILEARRSRWEAEQLAKVGSKTQAASDDKWKTKYNEPATPDLSKLSAPPEGWTWSTVKAVGDVLLGRQRAPQYLTGQWFKPYLRVANVKDDALDLSDVEQMDFDATHFEKYRLEPGDILVSEGQSPNRVGESAIYQGGIEGLCFQKTLHRFRAVSPGPSPKFAQIVFRAHVKTGVFQRMASITTNIAHLTLEKFEESPFPLPSLAEQHRIVAEVDRLLSNADETEQTLRAQLARASRLRQAVLKRAFEGKLVPQDPTDEPATALLARLRAEKASAPKPTSRPRKR